MLLIRHHNSAIRFFAAFFALALFLPGCSSYSRIQNAPTSERVELLKGPNADSKQSRPSEVLLLLDFSGGGTRAAALSYGVLEELRDTHYSRSSGQQRLLDEVDTISSVSGGSFTAAYYGLFGDQIFDDYEEAFLKINVQKVLVNGMLNPLNWFRFLAQGYDRTEMAIDYYDRNIFRGGTFADMAAQQGPQIQINATDLSIGQRFGFTKTRFNLLCSDLASFKVARAVAASSAVPVAFNPVVLENYDTCHIEEPAWLADADKRAQADPRLAEMVSTLDSYLDKENRRFIHLVDGGIADNLGVRAAYERGTVLGGMRQAKKILSNKTPALIAVIVVNAETNPDRAMDVSNETPGLREVLYAVSDTQLKRYNVESLALMKASLEKWASELSTPDQTVEPYFIQIGFESIADPDSRVLFNNVATSLALPADEVNRLTDAGRRLLRQSPEFRDMVKHIESLEESEKLE